MNHSDDSRPDPDTLLRAFSDEEKKKHSGRLRIFFGMSAGVGKTYAMLQAARLRQAEGIDVVVGVVETHGRQETAALLSGLPIISRKKINYKNTILEEMDIDAILARKPELVLVDELAHTNAPESRHPKRYQDVIEILEAGIDVYTAINVQHLESRKDVVEQITGVQIREMVPDSILERASQIELVDIAPSELLKRLSEGKVYLGDRAEVAAKNFFKEDRLTALREIALRMTAERVDRDLQRFVEVRQQKEPWQTNERLLVAISHSPYSEKLIRATRRLAYNLESPWIAIHVDTGIQLNKEDQAQLAKNINLARELKAEVITTTDTDILSALKRIARQKNVTQVVVGRPTRRWLRDKLIGGTFLDRLVWESIGVDVHVIRQDTPPKHRIYFFENFRIFGGPAKFVNTFWILLGTTLLGLAFENYIGYKSVGFIYLLSVLLVGLFSHIGSVILAASLSMFLWNFLFIPPKFTFHITDPEDYIMCVSYFVAALIVGFLTNRMRFHESILREREERQNVLFEILKDITNLSEKSLFLAQAIERVGKVLNAKCGILIKDIDGKLKYRTDRPYSIELTEKELAVATWAFEKRKMAGWSTDTLPEGKALYVPLIGAAETIGVFVFVPKENRKFSLEQENLLYSICQQLALALERHFFNKRLRDSERLHESERLHQTLLNSISHEMRTPLTTIMGSASALAEEKLASDPNFVRASALQLSEASDRLNRVIENLLDMSRLSSGVLALKHEWNDINDLLSITIKKLGKNLSRHKIITNTPSEMLMVDVDFRLMEHALSNVILNAATYSPPDTSIFVSAKKLDNVVRITVEDEGSGIPEEDVGKIFEKFYRVPGTPTGGTGLGLSIVKSIVEAHKGQVVAENRSEGGARFVIDLPFKKSPDGPSEKQEEL